MQKVNDKMDVCFLKKKKKILRFKGNFIQMKEEILFERRYVITVFKYTCPSLFMERCKRLLIKVLYEIDLVEIKSRDLELLFILIERLTSRKLPDSVRLTVL